MEPRVQRLVAAAALRQGLQQRWARARGRRPRRVYVADHLVQRQGGQHQERHKILPRRPLAAAAAISSSFFPFDVEYPFNFIDLGPTVPCTSVKLPAVAGWSAESNVALLHLWTLVKNASGYNACVGTVFNCPGAYDGTRGYTTSDVVEIQGRVMRTVDGRSFYLGRCAQG